MSNDYVVMPMDVWELVRSKLSPGYARAAEQNLARDVITVSASDTAAAIVGWSVVNGMLTVAQTLEHLGQPDLARDVNEMADEAASRVTEWEQNVDSKPAVLPAVAGRKATLAGGDGQALPGPRPLRLLS